ncbi:MAG TPA: ATP-binding protein [Longimicrobium sp.]|jgi:ATP-dependent DNA helicase RecG
MTRDELDEALTALRKHDSETPGIEAKRAQAELPRRVWETLSSFSNTPGGGVLLLGVDEEAGFSAAGVRDPAKLQADLGALCADQMEPPLRPLIQLWDVDGATIVSAEFPELPPDQKPCYYRGSGLPNGAFVRVGDGDRRLTPYEVQALFESRGQPHHDAEPLPGTGAGDLDPVLLEAMLQRFRERDGAPYREWSDEQLLRTLRILVPGADGNLVASLAGWLCFAPYPQDRFPNLSVSFTRYPGLVAGEPGPGGERFLDNVKIEGALPVVVVEAMRTLKRNMQRRGIVQGLYREDLWEYPETVLREALVNALGHRDYSPQARGAQVHVQMFPDRLEFLSPGGLFGPVQPDQLGEVGVQSSRNAHLMRLLEELPPPGERRPLCENRGTGLASILDQLRRAGMSPPRFDVTLTRFRLVIPNHTLYDPQTLGWLEAVTSELPLAQSQRQALAYARHGASLTNPDYCRVTGVDSRVATRELAELVDHGVLRREGVGRWSTYMLAGQAAPRAPRDRTRQDRGKQILVLLRDAGPLSARDIGERLGLSPSAVRYWLPRLRAEGIVVTTKRDATAPGMRYRLAPNRQLDN